MSNIEFESVWISSTTRNLTSWTKPTLHYLRFFLLITVSLESTPLLLLMHYLRFFLLITVSLESTPLLLLTFLLCLIIHLIQNF
jgi:hypothetical protein